MSARTLLIGALSLLASPASANADTPTLSYAVLSSALGICPDALKGTFDLNNAAALAEYGLAPDSADDEAELRAGVPGMEAARGRYDDGDILMANSPGGPCLVMVGGEGRFKVRDQLLAQFAESGAPGQRSDETVGESWTYIFDGVAAIVLTNNKNNTVSISVSIKE